MLMTKKLLFVPFVVLVLFLSACDTAEPPVPTSTPFDAALARLEQQQNSPEQQQETSTPTPAGAGDESQSTPEGTSEAGDSSSGSGSAEPAPIFVESGCSACHAVAGDGEGMLGPSLVGIATRATERIESSEYTGEATTAEEYIHESIVNPQVYTVPDYQPVMPANYGDTLSDEQLNQLTEYLLTLE